MSFQPSPTPTREGWYWAKWHTASDGTDHCRHCGHRHSDWTEPNGLEIEPWSVVEVVENSLNSCDPEYLMVQVGGVSQWQPLENFTWGPPVEEFHLAAEEREETKAGLRLVRSALRSGNTQAPEGA